MSAIEVVGTIPELRERHDGARGWGGVVGLVPTMGYLHAGHTSLMAAARSQCDLVTTTLFVNPLQFGPAEDLSTYPRDPDLDLALAEEAGVDVLFAPAVEEMYPRGRPLTTVTVDGLDRRWEGAVRPGHFAGVATVVAKLFAIAGPCRAYFGLKDYQQFQVVRRMAADIDLPVDVVGCPTVREPDGLALSSRNVYLDEVERKAALCLRRALDAAQEAVHGGERRTSVVNRLMAEVVGAEPRAQLDYAAVVDPFTLEPASELLGAGEQRLLIAARVGRPRLIDNDGLTVPAT